MRTNILKNALKMVFLLFAWGLVSNVHAIPTTQQINIFCTATEPCGQSAGTTADGTIFEAEANPTTPSTGTGVFKPFVRIQDNSGTQSGYNTDTGNPAINYDTKAGIWTRSVLFGELGTVDIGGLSYYQFSLDSNEAGNPNADPLAPNNKLLIDLTEVQIYIGGDELQFPESNGGYTGTQFDGSSSGNTLAGYNPVWTLDNATNGDVTVSLLSSICDTNGQCGSGRGDLNLFILDSFLSGAPDDYFSFYTEYDRVGSGFEEWRYLESTTTVPEPGLVGIVAIGLLAVGFARRKTN